MGKYLLIVAATVLATAAWGYLNLEDFQSYENGEDIADGPWHNWGDINPICCVDLGGDDKVGVFVPGSYDYWFYTWEGIGTALNCGMFFDFSYSSGAGNPRFGVSARTQYPYRVYNLAIKPAMASPHIELVYAEHSGPVATIWETDMTNSIEPGEWHTLGFYVYGEDPVAFQIYFDDVKIGSGVDDTYLLGSGWLGIGAEYINDYDDVYIDNITQLEENTSISPTSFGRLKTVIAE
jgi:hypothetical protein